MRISPGRTVCLTKYSSASFCCLGSCPQTWPAAGPPAVGRLGIILLERFYRLRGRPWSWRLRQSSQQLINEQEEALRLVDSAVQLLAFANRDWSEHGRGLRLEVNLPRSSTPICYPQHCGELSAHFPLPAPQNRGRARLVLAAAHRPRTESQLLARITPENVLWPLFQGYRYERLPCISTCCSSKPPCHSSSRRSGRAASATPPTP